VLKANGFDRALGARNKGDAHALPMIREDSHGIECSGPADRR
jgi:hypothetical protein